MYNMVKNIKVAYGKKKKDGKINKRDMPSIHGVPFKKMSIFFKYMPYWQDLAVRHSIDGMHIKKNVFESVIGILMDIKAKTKDGLKSQEDLVHLESRPVGTESDQLVNICSFAVRCDRRWPSTQ